MSDKEYQCPSCNVPDSVGLNQCGRQDCGHKDRQTNNTRAPQAASSDGMERVSCMKCGPIPEVDTYIALGNVRRHDHPCDGQITPATDSVTISKKDAIEAESLIDFVKETWIKKSGSQQVTARLDRIHAVFKQALTDQHNN